IYGDSPDYFTIREWDTAEGETFTDQDVRGATKVAVIGQEAAEELFGEGEDAIGEIIRIRNVPFKVVGILVAKGESASGSDGDGADDDDSAGPHCQCVACRRWHWHHEHHAGERHRTHARDWDPHGLRGSPPGHHAPVSNRSSHPERFGRLDRHCTWQ